MSDLGLAVVIEDDLDVRNLVEGVLLQSGFEVRTATGGREGVDLVREIGPDVVTLDVGLPDIDGFEVLRRIRQFSNAYVVVLTGREDEADLLAGLQGGADDYITKPFRPRELRARIAAMMRRPRPQSPPEDTPDLPLRLRLRRPGTAALACGTTGWTSITGSGPHRWAERLWSSREASSTSSTRCCAVPGPSSPVLNSSGPCEVSSTAMTPTSVTRMNVPWRSTWAISGANSVTIPTRRAGFRPCAASGTGWLPRGRPRSVDHGLGQLQEAVLYGSPRLSCATWFDGASKTSEPPWGFHSRIGSLTFRFFRETGNRGLERHTVALLRELVQ